MKKIILVVTILMLGLATSVSAASQNNVYVYFAKNRGQDKMLNALRESLSFSLEENSKIPVFIKSTDKLGKIGTLLTIKAMRQSRGWKRSLEVLYKVTDLKTNKVLKESKVDNMTLVAGFEKLAIVVGHDIVSATINTME